MRTFPLASVSSSTSALYTFLAYMVIVFAVAIVAGRVGRNKSFVGEYYLGGRNFGTWAFALTYAATLASGGSFMGFPALIYTHGWSLAWWICGYMVVPLAALSLFAKRLNQVGRIAGAITIPELLRKRFASGGVGNTATLLVVFFMFVYLLAQFKAGAMIMTTLLGDVPVFQTAVKAVDDLVGNWIWIGDADADYLICLVCFAIAVIAYTTYGGFRAVVWTDVLQGVVMLIGVLILMALALSQVGGLGKATARLAEQTPPEFATVSVIAIDATEDLAKGTWLQTEDGTILRLKGLVAVADLKKGTTMDALIITTEAERKELAPKARRDVTVEIKERTVYKAGAGEKGHYVTAPGPHKDKSVGFLPVMLALSFFAFWNFSGAGQPSYMVRQMAFRNTVVLRRSILFVAIFFTLIYLPLILIFTSARVLMPGMELEADRIMPELAAAVTDNAGVPWLAGILVAAPFAAIMSSVDSFLLLLSSGVVRDIYQENIAPEASEKTVARLSRWTTLILGALAVLFALNPPEFLQTLIVFASGGLGAAFLVPVILALYWSRMTARAAVVGMITGATVMLGFYVMGWQLDGKFGPYNWLGLHPFIWSSLANLAAVVMVTRTDSRRPADSLVQRYFGT